MADDLEHKRRQLKQVYNKLRQLERDAPNSDLMQQYRARSRQLVIEISDMEDPANG
jgi:hypothetical protein